MISFGRCELSRHRESTAKCHVRTAYSCIRHSWLVCNETGRERASCDPHHRTVDAQKGHSEMKAVILAGGAGTRISEETYLKPKPMIDIGGKPILWHIMKIYAYHGINDFIVCLGYKGY